MLRYAGKPHWAKTHPLRPEDLRKSYPRFDDFVALVERVDPAAGDWDRAGSPLLVVAGAGERSAGCLSGRGNVPEPDARGLESSVPEGGSW